MDLLLNLFGKRKEEAAKTLADYQREALIKQGEEQFQKLVERGLTVPVALL